MKRKNNYWIFLFCFLFCLAACTGKPEKKSVNTNSPKQSSVRQEQSASASQAVSKTAASTQNSSAAQEAADQETKAHFNGSYYSVAGKYGEVIIVNKKHPLSPTYAPGEDPTAQAAFWQLLGDMQAAGFSVSNQYSGFRSYETQSHLYHGYLAADSQENVDSYSARPGYSEHQTGLAFDLLDSSGALLTEPAAASWLSEHAPHYGFIVRYQAGKEEITGFMAETWHIRYIGKEAMDIYQSGLTLEEYFGVPGGDYIQ